MKKTARGKGRGSHRQKPAAAAAAAAAKKKNKGEAPKKEERWVVEWDKYGLKKDEDVREDEKKKEEKAEKAEKADREARMVVNNAGARQVFELDDMKRLQRFLCLGVEGGTYYVGEKELGLQNMQAILRLLAAGRGMEVVNKLIEYSVEGRTAKQQPLMLALAVCARLAPNDDVRRAAYACLGRVCRIPTQLFMLIKYMRLMGDGAGWGRMQRKAIQAWYNDKEPMELARAVTKYANREGWTHMDVLRLAHAKPASDMHQLVFQYITKGWDVCKDAPQWTAAAASAEAAAAPTAAPTDTAAPAAKEPAVAAAAVESAAQASMASTVSAAVTRAVSAVASAVGFATAAASDASSSSSAAAAAAAAAAAGPSAAESSPADFAESAAKLKGFLAAVQTVKAEGVSEDVAVKLICEHGLAREHLSTSLLNSRLVWETLLQHMPLNAMIRNLSKMTSLELFNTSDKKNAVAAAANVKLVVKKLTDQRQLRSARMHPFNILVALKQYQSGKGDKGSLTWVANKEIVDALDQAFQLSFAVVEPSGKRFVLALDVSGSMGSGAVNGSTCMTPRDASAAMAMVTLRVEKQCHTVGFCDKLTELPLRPDMSLGEITKKISGLPFGSTDCAQPMLWALERNIKADVFVVYTDNETWSGQVKPVDALLKYRRATGIPAKLVVVGMTASQFTIADPNDAGMLDLCGFDSAGPQIMADFAADRL